MPRSFLVLQGTASLFFSRLAETLASRGHAVCRVNFCGGDWFYGRTKHALNYCGKLSDLPLWYADIVSRERITDVLMFGDCREIHRHLHPVAERFGLRVHVFEEGYVRPHWITLERHGVNGRSLMPSDPAAYLGSHVVTPPAAPGKPTGYNLYERVFHDIAYRIANALLAWRFPRYRSHRPRNGLVEYAGLAFRALMQGRHHRHAEAVTRTVLGGGKPYYLFPLQLNSDAQIVVHSPFAGVREAIEQVVRSFARHAPADALLLIKNHPLDTGMIEYRGFAQRVAAEEGVAERVAFINAGHLPTLLEHARGVVVVNSTVGLSALHHERPLIALGTAIYNLPGLTWQGTLDDFWHQREQPDMDLYHAFLDYVMYHTQINGDFYTRTGIAMAVAGAADRLDRADG
ncbi:capsule biosynthesis protein [Burkholderia plantarii]|uniref:Putative capsule polysaccharide biosynthesis/export protein WcbO n=1 Tax=Burkholderia plantarii TaxID=41899 RepID=A0A0B6RVU2_BURPL|nr:capsular biosynthesis protein [Burkholderia plantarii]AJK45180.1 putative capsule polysaccharide biosynthesis/export protein WcbO [Burkholderia plantarii]ALK29462.1 capsule polysaccharide export protein WcbO [Burkholderia plantarii]WLE61017.1 capsular biosynthesis protein [Burkholderia plantarii]GLZ21803.1 capsule polysaccharide biosynthesis/export protein [Burkholderia plantarii]